MNVLINIKLNTQYNNYKTMTVPTLFDLYILRNFSLFFLKWFTQYILKIPQKR